MLPAFLSGIFLLLSYPSFPFGFLAWSAVAPLLTALEKSDSRGDAFLKGYITGIIFFAGTLPWLINVTFIGWIALSAFQALFIGLFGILIYEGRRFSFFAKIFWAAISWTTCELFRSKFPVLGFNWNLLGYTQAFYPLIVQSANTVGIYGVGFAIMFVNAALAAGNARFLKEKSPKAFFLPGLLCVAVFISVFSHGIYHRGKSGKHIGDWKISVLQGNIPQSVKWELMARDKINEIYLKLTELAAYDKTDLIIWPEAAFPGYFNKDWDAQPVRDLVKKIQVPTLVGTTLWEAPDQAYNSAVLLGTDGLEKQRYDKQVLVPFGEYVPLKFLMGNFTAFAESLGISDFSFGKDKTVFQLLNGEVSFSVLICFEDAFPELAQEFVDRGAQFLAVITNDAWFGHSGAAAQHLQASIFRAVEQGVPVVRAANTGISGFVSNTGQVLDLLKNEKGDPLFFMGHKTFTMPVDNKPTLYRFGGRFFPYGAAIVFAIMFAFLKLQKSEK